MTYQVLARKWRPKDFASLVGQEHVVRALTHALDAQRLHHAYLFTGTRGVGKTTLSRILAKALNCETGITSTPCGVCNACRAIDEGRFVDYVEMDAASNRGVEEMASLLERAVYGPVDARFKVYMIDEVHMLTNHAFNAMLKTLEEPPAHVKFILATTDPQKIPVTVLSRCLQFNLKQMPPPHIVGHLEHILAAEQIAFEPQALRLLARAADGSMRDALSLTDQAIAYSAGSVGEEAVRGMLGALDQSYLIRLLDAVAVGDGTVVLAIADEMAGRSLSFSTALADLAGLLHRVAWGQFAPASVLDEWPEAADIRRFAQALSAEQVQLLYQIATIGRAELGLAPDEYAGFSMTLLRMLAFRPVNDRIADRLGAPPAPSTPSSMPPGGAVPRSTASTARIASAMPTQAQASSESKPAVERSTMVEPASDEWGDPTSETPASVMAQPIERSVPVEPIREEGIAPTAKAVPESMAQVLTQPVERSVPLERPAEAVNEAAKESSAPVTTQPAGEPTVQPRSEPADAPQASAVTTAFDLPEKPMSPARAALEAMRMSGLRVPTDKSRMNAALTPAPRRPSSTPSAPLVVPTPRRPSPPAAAPATAKASDAEFTRSPNVSSAASNVGSNSGSPVDTPPWDAIPDSAYEGGYDGDHGMPSSGDFDDTASYSAPSRAAAPGRAAGAPAGAAAPASSHVTEVVPKEPPVLLSAFGEDVDWPTFVTRLSLRGFARELAFRSELLSVVGATLELRVAVPQLGDRSHVDKLKAELDTHLGRPVELSIVGGAVHYTAAAIEDARRARQQLDAERSIERDPFVQSLIRDFGASIVPGSIRPVQTAPIAPSA